MSEMATLLGIASGVISILQAVERLDGLLKKIKDYRGATNEVFALINEVSDLQLILTEHRDIAEQLEHANPIFSSSLQKALQDTGEKIAEIDCLIRSTLTRQEQGSQLKVNKVSWVRKKAEIDMLRQQLKGLRRKTAEHFQVITL